MQPVGDPPCTNRASRTEAAGGGKPRLELRSTCRVHSLLVAPAAVSSVGDAPMFCLTLCWKFVSEVTEKVRSVITTSN